MLSLCCARCARTFPLASRPGAMLSYALSSDGINPSHRRSCDERRPKRDQEPRLSRAYLLRPVQVGGFRDEPVGPHPVANVQVIFTPEQFQPVVEWLMLHRDGLDVLIHPLTDNSVADHSRYALWLGSPVPLKLDTLRGNYRPELLPSA